jgi:Family of unknown function (DUF6521)
MMVGKFFEARAKRGNEVNIVQVRATRAILIQRWTGRPREEANLLNPAFCCTALTSSIVGYMGVDAEGMPYPLAFMILPRPYDLHSVQIRKSDDLDNACAKINAFSHKRLQCKSYHRPA